MATSRSHAAQSSIKSTDLGSTIGKSVGGKSKTVVLRDVCEKVVDVAARVYSSCFVAFRAAMEYGTVSRAPSTLHSGAATPAGGITPTRASFSLPSGETAGRRKSSVRGGLLAP